MRRTAELSLDERHRYSLTRRWGPGPTMLFVMLNPSTADAFRDDATIRRCIGFAKREGCGGIIVVNLYSFRTRHPSVLFKIQPSRRLTKRTDEAIFDALCESDVIVAAWGAKKQAAERALEVSLLLPFNTKCLGRSKSGAPRHPLMVKSNQPLEPFFPEKVR